MGYFDVTLKHHNLSMAARLGYSQGSETADLRGGEFGNTTLYNTAREESEEHVSVRLKMHEGHKLP